MRRFAVCVHCGKRQSNRVQNRIAVANSYVTPSEAAVLALRAQGMSVRAIGKRLSKHFKTVDTLLRNARERLNAPNNFQLVEIYRASNRIRERDRSSNRDDSRSTVSTARNRVDAVTGDSIGPGAAPSRAL